MRYVLRMENYYNQQTLLLLCVLMASSNNNNTNWKRFQNEHIEFIYDV